MTTPDKPTTKIALDLTRLRRALDASLPVIGPWRRRRAAARLELEKERPVVVSFLVELFESHRKENSAWAAQVLSSLQTPTARDTLCEAALGRPRGGGATVAMATGYQPTDPERACVFLFVTRQLDRYFEEDFEFQNLRLEYDRAEPELRAHILSVLRSGDSRCLGFFGARKKLSECSSREIMLALQSFRKHGDHARLFRSFLELPLKYGLPILGELAATGWEPDDAVEKSLLKQALAERRGHAYPPPRGDPEPGAWVAQQLRAGSTSETVRGLTEEELIERLGTASPTDGVVLVGAIAARPVFSLQAAKLLEQSPHWMIRFAAASSGIFADLSRDEWSDENFWVRANAPKVPVLEFWPQRATPAHLEALTEARPAAWQGALGAARKVLHLLLAYRITTGQFDALVVEGDVFAGSFESADEELPPWGDANGDNAFGDGAIGERTEGTP